MKQPPQSLLDENNTKGEKSSNRILIAERQGKNLYQTSKSELVIQEFISNGIVEIKTRAVDEIRNRISSYLFEHLEGFHIPTHFVSKLSETEMMIKRTDTVPISVKVYNMVNGAFTKRFNLKETVTVDFPIIEHYYSNGTKSNAWMNEYHIYAMSLATPEEFKQINRISMKVYAILRGLCDRRSLVISDLLLEFGRYKGQIVLTGELSPLTCHFLDASSEQKTKRDRFSPDENNAEENLAELFDRLVLKV